jgi:hypothetical protein
MEKHRYNGKHVIVRADRAGVFFGILEEKNGNNVILKDVRKLYRWYGSAAVEQLAAEGTSKPDECMFTMTVYEMEIANAIQVIPCTEKSIESIKSVEEWKR